MVWWQMGHQSVREKYDVMTNERERRRWALIDGFFLEIYLKAQHGLWALCCMGLFSSGLLYAQQGPLQVDHTRALFHKTAAMGFGGAYRSIAKSSDSMVLNPAGIAQKKGQLTAGVDYVKSGYDQSQLWNVSLTDYKAIPFMAVGFSYDRHNPTLFGTEVSVQQFTLTTAKQITPWLYVGNNIKAFLTSFNSGPGGADGVDFDMGTLFLPNPYFSGALTVHNMFKGTDFEEFPLLVGASMTMSVPNHARFSFDLSKNFNTPSTRSTDYSFGAEITITEGVFLRGGLAFLRVTDDRYYSAGVAIEGPKMTLLFSYAQFVDPTNHVFAGQVEFAF